jgi:hypothetical protein
MTDVPRQVGTPDPRRRTSPIWGLDEGAAAASESGESCFFNNEAFSLGAQSDDALLRCEHGSWVVIESPAGQPS